MTAPTYDEQRTAEDFRARDVGEAIAEALRHAFGQPTARLLVLDSGVVRETLGELVLDELRRAGYEVRFRRGGHV